MKICSKCQSLKEENQFSPKTNGKLNSWCKECIRTHNREKYKNNSDERKRVRKNVKNIYNRNREYVLQYLSDKSCSQCPENHIAALDFHHRDPNQKEQSIARLSRNGISLDRIKKEIEKCDILCSNCHRKLHYNLRNS